MGATALLATQPPPAGRTVAIVSNVGGAGVLAADACTDLGLDGAPPARRRPSGGCARSSPTAARSAGRWTPSPRSRPTTSARRSRCSRPTRRCTRSSRWCCAPAPPATCSRRSRDADLGVPLAVVVLNQPEAVRTLDTRRRQGPRLRLPGGGGQGARPRRAVRANGARRRARSCPPSPTWTPSAAASSCTPSWPPGPDGGWLPAAESPRCSRLLRATAGARRRGAGRGRRGGHRRHRRPDVRTAGGARPRPGSRPTARRPAPPGSPR